MPAPTEKADRELQTQIFETGKWALADFLNGANICVSPPARPAIEGAES
jgi:hypothetical protein